MQSPKAGVRSRLRLLDAVREAGAAVGQRPVRTLLTALGTILGVGAFVATTGLAETARAQVSSRFDALKATEVRVQDEAPDGTNPFPMDVDARLDGLNGVTAGGVYFMLPDDPSTAPRATASRAQQFSVSGVPVIAATPGAIEAALATISAGRIYDEFHETRAERVAVVGRGAASALGITRIDNQPTIFIGDRSFTVLGIIDDVERIPELLAAVTIPMHTAQRYLPTGSVDRQVLIDTAPGAAQLIGQQAAMALRPQDPERLRVLIPPDPRSLRNKVESDVQSLFYALSALALLIGAVAITNATMLNIIERRHEIGLRRALGATRSHIVRQVTLEATLIGTLAGVLGTTIGIIGLTAVSAARQWAPTAEAGVLLIAPLSGIVTGALAGIAPALKAARTPPAETLRS